MDDRRHRGRGRHREREGWWGGPRMRRGQIRTALLAVLAEAPGHGYDVMQTLEDKSGGLWRPSPGSVYPTLQQLEDEGLVRSNERDGKRVYEITDAGRAEATSRVEEEGGPPWEAAAHGGRRREAMQAMRQFLIAYRQITEAGTAEQVDRAISITTDARRQLYQMLAE